MCVAKQRRPTKGPNEVERFAQKEMDAKRPKICSSLPEAFEVRNNKKIE
jgi:hypothetical protein